MIRYTIMRNVTVALRAVSVKLLRAFYHTSGAASALGERARFAGLSALRAAEDRAQASVIRARQETDAAIDKLLAVEEDLEIAFEDLCYKNAEVRRNIINEVL